MVDVERLRQKVQILQSELNKLDKISKYDFEQFQKTPFVADACLRNLQTAIEALVDIGGHIIARQNLGLPKTYADVIRLMVQAGFLPVEKEGNYINMIRFRNRIVHMYADVDLREVYHILHSRLDDFRGFISTIVRTFFAE